MNILQEQYKNMWSIPKDEFKIQNPPSFFEDHFHNGIIKRSLRRINTSGLKFSGDTVD